jgi:hypothetical protein
MKRKSQRKYRMEREGDEAYNCVRYTTKFNTRLVPENEDNVSELTLIVLCTIGLTGARQHCACSYDGAWVAQ